MSENHSMVLASSSPAAQWMGICAWRSVVDEGRRIVHAGYMAGRHGRGVTNSHLYPTTHELATQQCGCLVLRCREQTTHGEAASSAKPCSHRWGNPGPPLFRQE